MNMIFEVADLAVASPATVSRCGMVYVQPDLLGWRPVLQSWLAKLPPGVSESQRAEVAALFDWLLPPLLRLALRGVKAPLPMQDINLAVSCMRLMEAHLDEFRCGLTRRVGIVHGAVTAIYCKEHMQLCSVSIMLAPRTA